MTQAAKLSCLVSSATCGPGELVALAGDRIDILVNNVGGSPARTGGFLAITDKDWLATLNLNLMTAVRATLRRAARYDRGREEAIVNVCPVNFVLSDPAVTVGLATGTRPEEVEKSAASATLTGRFTRPDEVADLVLMLASDVTANVTGTDIRIDGGLVPTW